MKKITIALLLVSSIASAQNTRVIYEHEFRPDSTSKTVETELMYLDIGKNGSHYYSRCTFESDSLAVQSIEKQLADGVTQLTISKSRTPGEVGYEVDKTYPDYRTSLICTIGDTAYSVLEDRRIEWKILPDKKTINTFQAQKATTNFAGRKWTAWFTSDLPLRDGPYKFSGLPGLIVQIYDQTGSHKITMKGKKEVPEFYTDKRKRYTREYSSGWINPREISRKQYRKELADYKKDPMQGMRHLFSPSDPKVKVHMDGAPIADSKNLLQTLEKNARQGMKHNNNKIELVP